MSVKIRQLEIENVKRVKAVTLTPTENGLTVIGGRNGQGKTSVLDAIAWALGGNKLKPSESQRIGSAAPPSIHIELSNGMVVERKGKSSALHVIDPSGQKAGQQLLDSFIEKLALNLPKFMDARNDEKAETLLQIIGVGDQLAVLDRQEKKSHCTISAWKSAGLLTARRSTRKNWPGIPMRRQNRSARLTSSSVSRPSWPRMPTTSASGICWKV